MPHWTLTPLNLLRLCMEALWRSARALYDDLPGPHWLKITIVVTCLILPGCFDELALVGLVTIFRYLRKRKTARFASTQQA
jgi:hypothetical protein